MRGGGIEVDGGTGSALGQDRDRDQRLHAVAGCDTGISWPAPVPVEVGNQDKLTAAHGFHERPVGKRALFPVGLTGLLGAGRNGAPDATADQGSGPADAAAFTLDVRHQVMGDFPEVAFNILAVEHRLRGNWKRSPANLLRGISGHAPALLSAIRPTAKPVV